MTREDLQVWAQSHSYPQLVNEEEACILVRHGKEAWAELLADSGRVQEAIARLEMFAKFEAMREEILS